MADDAIFLPTARGEVRIATDKIIDPQFGPVHLLRIVGGAGGGGSGMSLLEFQGELPLPVLEQGWPASFGSVQSGAWNVGVNNFPASQPVTGTFWQATQPVSGPLTNAELRAAAVPVSGTFWQATQPVSGTFWQATQPVSGPLTDTQLRAAAVPVSMSSGAAWTVNSSNGLAPAANAVLSDTGALAAGTYEFMFEIAFMGVVAAGKGLIVEHRNAANSATLNTLGGLTAPGQITWTTKLTLALNERVRVINAAIAGGATERQITAIYRRAG